MAADKKRGRNTRNKIFKRIMLLCYAIATVTVAVFAFAMITFEKRNIRSALEDRAQEIGGEAADHIARELADADIEQLGHYFASVVDDGRVVDYIAVTDVQTGDSLVHTIGVRRPVKLGGIWKQKPDLTSSEDKGQIIEGPLGDGRQSYHHPFTISAPDSRWDLIHVGLSLTDYRRALRSLYQLVGLAAAVTFGAGTALSWLFTRRLTGPLLQLQQHAHRIAGGGEASRAEIHTNDEIEDLAESINAMVAALEHSKQTIRDSLAQQQSLREKDVLLREIHHRVKNNMQILSSMIRLQTRRAESAELRQVLAESEARIRSMGLLHEKLYQSDSVSMIEVESYMRSLTNELMRMNTRQSSKIELKLAVAGIQMGLDTALPCGLIVTELISNSMKYAFPEGRPGAILVSVCRTSEGEYSLIVWDNGIGVPENFDISKAKSLGLRLVTMLCAQLNGQLHVSGQRGTRVEIRFKESEYANRY